MAKCRVCGIEYIGVPLAISLCKKCLVEKVSYEELITPHLKWRDLIGLRRYVDESNEGVKCNICVNECLIPVNSRGYCGVVLNRDGRLTYVSGGIDKAILYSYYDPIPTNCVASYFCPASTGVGYPKFAVKSMGEDGYYNLAIFFGGCNIDCLFCQNIEHKHMVSSNTYRKYVVSIENLLDRASDDRITCICFFGGDPTPHSLYTIRFGEQIINKYVFKGGIKRLCWETNGLENTALFKRILKLALDSGGIVKIDWKAFNPKLYTVLSGVDGYKAVERVKKNVDQALKFDYSFRGYPLLAVSTLVIPHYIDYEEVYNIASYIAERNPETPYILLAFYPHHLMSDSQVTSKKQMMECVKAARDAGLRRIYIGNAWMLS